MKINRGFLPIKAHFFFLMAAMGPILPQLPVFGKELGISPVIMGSISAILPVAFLFIKPILGLLVDIFRKQRRTIFLSLILLMTISFTMISFLPAAPKIKFNTSQIHNYNNTAISRCTANLSWFSNDSKSDCYNSNNRLQSLRCNGSCFDDERDLFRNTLQLKNSSELCSKEVELFQFGGENFSSVLNNCDLTCDIGNVESVDYCFYGTLTFWGFVIFMCIGCVLFNAINSISDAICFDIIVDQHDYGKQRVWGTIGFGLTALISGYVVNLVSNQTTGFSYNAAFVLMVFCVICDLLACSKLQLPIIKRPENIFRDVGSLIKNRGVIVFFTFAVFIGVLDSFIIFFLFWYLEDLAESTSTTNVKLIEGIIVAAETLGGEVIFFYISGRILKRFGYVYSFSMCFLNYSIRLMLISLAPSPWWIVPIEFCMQGPTYALTYTTIVEYANEIAPVGASATIQALTAGMDDGLGYLIGGASGGLLYSWLGGATTLQILSVFSLICAGVHLILQHFCIATNRDQYKAPNVATEAISSD